MLPFLKPKMAELEKLDGITNILPDMTRIKINNASYILNIEHYILRKKCYNYFYLMWEELLEMFVIEQIDRLFF